MVPEIASRNHLEKIDEVIRLAMEEAGKSFSDLTAVAVTYGPGLVGSLLVGVSEAKALAYAIQKPLIPVHHIEGHIAANYLAHQECIPPYVCLGTSGGHSHLRYGEDYGKIKIPEAQSWSRVRKRETPLPIIFPRQNWIPPTTLAFPV